MSEMTKTTVILTTDQLAKLEYLRKTTITGKTKEEGEKTLEEITYQAIERGIASIEQTRKQYLRTRAAVKAYKG